MKCVNLNQVRTDRFLTVSSRSDESGSFRSSGKTEFDRLLTLERETGKLRPIPATSSALNNHRLISLLVMDRKLR